MEAKVIVAYVVCDDVIKNLKIQDDPQARMSLSEVMTTAIVSAIEYSGNLEKARMALNKKYYIPNMLSKSQLNRRLHKIDKSLWDAVLKALFVEFKKQNICNEFIIDSCPIAACKLARRKQNKVYCEKEYFGYCASQEEYFIGLKLHMICDVNGNPVELFLQPGSKSDIASFRRMSINLPKNSSIYADKAYNDYNFEDMLIQQKQIHLLPIRKKNSKRRGGGFMAKIRRKKRKIIETAFSCIKRLMPRSIHAVTKKGFELKVTLFVLAYAFNKMF